MKHRGKVRRRSGSGSKWESVRCSCGWSKGGGGWFSRRELEAEWRQHVRDLGGVPSLTPGALDATTPDP